MVDRISKEHRSWNMSRIRGKNTKPEIVVRKLLHHAGYRFRLYVSELPGKPDIVLPKYQTVIFVNGCYWHRHKGCKEATIPKTRADFWLKKFRRTVERDQQKQVQLEQLGWTVITVWECEVNSEPELTLNCVKHQLHNALHT